MQSPEQSGGPLGDVAPSLTVDDVGAADCDDDGRGRKKRPREDETDVGGDVVGGGGPGVGVGVGIGDDDDREGGGEKEKGDEDRDDGPRPFVLLPFHGEHKRAVSSLSFAPSAHLAGSSWNSGGDGRRALCASASADGSARVWDVATSHRGNDDGGEGETATLTATTKAAAADDIGGGGGTMTSSSSSSSSVRLDPRLSLTGHSRGINDVAWSPTAAYVATASDDKTLRLWSAETGDAFVEFRGHTNFVFSCRFNPQSNLLVSGSFDETVKLWDVRCGECVATLPAHSNPVTGVDFNRDGTCIVSGSYDGLVRIWDTATGECLKTVYAEGNPPVGGVRFSPNGRYVLSGTLDGRLRLYDLFGGGHTNERHGVDRPQPRGGKCAKTYAGHVNSRYCVFAAFLSSNPRRRCVVSGSEDGRVYLYDLQSRLARQTLEGHTDAVLAVDAHDSLELIGSGGMGNDRCVRFWAPSSSSSSRVDG